MADTINFDYKIIKGKLSKIPNGSRILDLYSYNNELLFEIWPFYKIIGIDTNVDIYIIKNIIGKFIILILIFSISIFPLTSLMQS
ncbi:hypothetical protein IC006_0480 [Sulfuracidifex tepidarius]|uniref:Uncharacterized protein n=1 Tax=Sulfuracidifex tepidarius TaxID=1294262 RepID=A0A510DSM5_9CREN|nr:hypothetical protein IC006_0480 [Sulfuracidifex tepidarius]